MARTDAKAAGAYYTTSAVARALTRWAVRRADDRVLDPSFGGGVFLEAAGERLRTLGGGPSSIYGVELDAGAHAEARARGLAPAGQLLNADFFFVTSRGLPPMDAVIGNPPYIRFHRFTGQARRQALAQSERAGVRLSGQVSAWAPFVICSIERLNAGGRLAMVLPAEMGHARYAGPVLEHLLSSFASSLFITFTAPLFPHLSQATVVLLAEGRGQPFEGCRSLHLAGAAALEQLGRLRHKARLVDARAFVSGRERLHHHLLDRDTLALYREQANAAAVVRLGDIAQVGLGYVSGANSFFHLSPQQASARGIPARNLQAALFRTPRRHGLALTREDWQAATADGRAGYVLVPGEPPLDPTVRDYLQEGENAAVPLGYKTRNRNPWYRVPGIRSWRAGLTPMAGEAPVLFLNQARLALANTLYGIDVPAALGLRLAVGWLSSFTAVSTELEGHALGGGLLKLEPREARAVRVALPPTVTKQEAAALEGLLRHGDKTGARRLADRLVLVPLGLTPAACEHLYQAAAMLRSVRNGRATS